MSVKSKSPIEISDEEFLQKLQQSGGASIQEICEAAGVTATAIRMRLIRLQNQGLIARETIRAGRGRPHHAYRVTDAGRQKLGDNYSELALLLWEELSGIEESGVRQRVTNRIRATLAERYGRSVRGNSLSERFDELKESLLSRGFRVEVVSAEGLPILRENNCPYHELSKRDPGICELEQEVFEQVLGTKLKLTSCCRDGHACCEFHPVVSQLEPVGVA